jgi:VanZ family protein
MQKIMDWFLHQPKLSKLLATCWTIIIIIGCSLPGKELPKISLWQHTDKLVHFTFFAVFVFFWFIAKPSQQRLWRLFTIALLFGVAIEYYQKYFVVGRSFDVWDAVADAIGAGFAAMLISKLYNPKNNEIV